MKNMVMVFFLLFVWIACLSALGCKGFDYGKAWKEIDESDLNKYPKTAFTKVSTLYKAAIKDKRSEDQIKALLYLISLQKYLEEESDQIVFNMMDENIRSARFPDSAILHSIRAEMYWSYYQNHYYTEKKPSENADFKLTDIATWDMKSLARGSYVFEYPLRVSNKGDFSNGISSIQSMYAPEFSAHSEGIRVEVK